MSRGYERPHVLIVSDDLGLSRFLSEGLLVGGFWTSVIASGIQVLEVFRLRTFDLVLLDAGLSGVGSMEVLRRLRGWFEGEIDPALQRTDIPILLVAAAADEVDEAGVAQYGGNGVLYAPLEIGELAPQLMQVVLAWRMAHPGRLWADEASASPRA